jgi:hypothetical protein
MIQQQCLFHHIMASVSVQEKINLLDIERAHFKHIFAENALLFFTFLGACDFFQKTHIEMANRQSKG